MHPARIAELLEPFMAEANDSPVPSDAQGGPANDQLLTASDLDHISTYIDLLLRWNTKINLTAIRDPEQIVTRHFGESLFAARHLFPRGAADAPSATNQRPTTDDRSVADVGSGAGFPGIPIKLWAPQIALTLIESNHKKATFLREVARALTLTNVDIFPGRAQQLHQALHTAGEAAPSHTTRAASRREQTSGRALRTPQPAAGSQTQPPTAFDLVTLRAVERFADVLPVAASLVSPGGRLALLIGSPQLDEARSRLTLLTWDLPLPLPLSQSRALLVGHQPQNLQ